MDSKRSIGLVPPFEGADRWVLGCVKILTPGLTVSPYDVLVGGELAERHRPPGVELLGGDADLGPEAELLAVGESGGGVDGDGARVDGADEASGGGDVLGDDRLGVAGPEAVDVSDGGVEVSHDRHRHLEGQEFPGEVVV